MLLSTEQGSLGRGRDWRCDTAREALQGADRLKGCTWVVWLWYRLLQLASEFLGVVQQALAHQHILLVLVDEPRDACRRQQIDLSAPHQHSLRPQCRAS